MLINKQRHCHLEKHCWSLFFFLFFFLFLFYGTFQARPGEAEEAVQQAPLAQLLIALSL